MGQRVPTNPTKKPVYKVIGAIEFIPETEVRRFGYLDDYEDVPNLIYEREGSTDLFTKVAEFDEDGHFKRIYDYMIQARHTIEEAQELFPELFL